MQSILTWIEPVASLLVCTAVTAIAGFLGNRVRILCNRFFEDKSKKTVAEVCVKAVEQLYHGFDGETKKEKALLFVERLLTEKGIPFTSSEMHILIESAVSEFCNALTA